MAIIIKSQNTNETPFLPLVAIREGVIFPHTETVLTFGRPKSINAVTAAYKSDKQVILVTQKDPNKHDPGKDDLFEVGIIATIERTLKTDNELNALIRGIKRVRITNIKDEGNLAYAQAYELEEIGDDANREVEALSKHLTGELKKAVSLGKSVEFLNFMKLMSGVSSSELADQVASVLDIKTEEKQVLLETLDVKIRLEAVITHLTHELKVLEIERNIASKTQKKFDKSMKEAVLRERLKTIKKELGDEEDDDQEIAELKKKVKKAKMTEEVEKKVMKELNRLAKMSIHNPESSYIRTWLDTIVELPWSAVSKDVSSVKKAQAQLDKDHYALKEVKERIIEYLSVLKLKSASKKEGDKEAKVDKSVPTILCFSGPPGVGKTSIGKSIAKALGREFVKVSLGGIRDEAEVRGHRRTYVGAMPGRIIQGIMNAKTKNPIFMLDEIDKIGNDFRGDPSAALLEALDPEQNKEFSDHYLEVPFDLSQVIFITTANILDTIPPALRDRLEIIPFSGYTANEKFQIAKKHLVEKTLSANGLSKEQVEIPNTILHDIIKHYTKESGVRNLERQISKVLRKVAKKYVEGETTKTVITVAKVRDFLGPEKFVDTIAEKTDEVGVATGLAWTQVGGDILFIEVALMPGKGKVTITGQLGDVMKESAQAAMSYVRSKWEQFDIDKYFYQNTDIHIHVPEGAVPKDGPSAGVTITTALVSALTNKKIRKDVGMTGEITLRGKVLEIGGLKEKSIAAHRAGLKHIYIPFGNKKDLVQVPDEVKKDITFHPVKTIDELLKGVFI